MLSAVAADAELATSIEIAMTGKAIQVFMSPTNVPPEGARSLRRWREEHGYRSAGLTVEGDGQCIVGNQGDGQTYHSNLLIEATGAHDRLTIQDDLRAGDARTAIAFSINHDLSNQVSWASWVSSN